MLRWGLIILLLLLQIASASENRIALIIGNSSYSEYPLANPVNDATDVAATLKNLHCEVIIRTNTTFLEMEKTVREFGNLLRQNKGIGLFYYAGHGIQLHGNNYLIPIDADIEDEVEVKHKALDVDLVLGKMELAENNVNLLILDACRNNPYERRFRSVRTRGLAQMSAPSGTVIWYATRPGKIALDGQGRNSPFTYYLVDTLRNENLKAREVISRIAVRMRKEGLSQEPWQEGIWLEDFYFTQAEIKNISAQSVKTSTHRPAVEPVTWQDEEESSSSKEKVELAKVDKKVIKAKSTIESKFIGNYPNIMGIYGGTGTIASYTAAASGGVKEFWNEANTILDQSSNGEFRMELEASSMFCEGEGKFINENEISGSYNCRCRGAEYAFCGVNFGNTRVNLNFKGKLSNNFNEIEFNYGGTTKESNHSSARVIIKEKAKAMRKK